MSSFTDPLTVTKVKDGIWKVSRPFRYYVGSLDSSEFIDVPEGYETDFASVPRIFWSILPPDGQYTQAAVLHDYLYTYHTFNREKCDRIFLEAMKVLGVKKWIRGVMFYSVRFFGEYAYQH